MFLDKKFKNFDSSDFKEASNYAKKNNYLTNKSRRALYSFGQTISRGRPLSEKQKNWAEQLIQELKDLGRKTSKVKETFQKNSHVVNHITVRQAWHDNKWNGKVCQKPAENDYCVGDYSLLSSRIRHRRNDEVENNCVNCIPDIKSNDGYIPPCYWSINTFGDSAFDVTHKHPMSRVKTSLLKETLDSFAVFTWPFKLSFNKDRAQLLQQGSYPKNLEKRIENYFSRVHPEESIAFTYCNYDNPVSGDDQQYLVTGCGIVKNVVSPDHFKIENFDEIKSQKNNQNFPTINWSTQVQLEKDTIIRLPYHEYLEDALSSGDFSFLDRVKVTISEPQLIRCFKYVSMDMDDDEAIYLLTKIKRSLDIVQVDAYYKKYPIDPAVSRLVDMLEHCWTKRGYFPGFADCASVVTGRPDSNVEFGDFIKKLTEQISIDDQYESLSEVLNDPSVLEDYDLGRFEDLLCELIDSIQSLRLSFDDFLKISMMGLLRSQFEKIIGGDQNTGISSKRVLENPYLLFESYREDEWEDDLITGEVVYGPIDLFKIDIAFFPDRKYLKRKRKLQYLSESDKGRLRAIIIQHLENLKPQGHCFDWDTNIMESLDNYPLFYKTEYRLPSDLLDHLDEELENFLQHKLTIKNDKNRNYFYLNEIFEAEEYIANTINKLLEMGDLNKQYSVDLTESIQKLSEKLGNAFDQKTYIAERTQLFNSIFNRRLYVLTGLPGSGKSYELLRTIQKLRVGSEDYTLLTPTGKAALRLTLNEEKFENINAKTIDKFLTDNQNAPSNSIELENVIIDEMSMVDLEKFFELIQLINFNSNRFKRLILVGDPNQLPPIGCGKVFVDIIEYLLRNTKYHLNLITLETNCRVEQDRRIEDVTTLFGGEAKYGERIIQAIARGDTQEIRGLNISFWRTRDELRQNVHEEFIKLSKKMGICDEQTSVEIYLNRILGLRDNGTVDNSDYNFQERIKIDAFQIISPYRAGYYGSLGLNLYIQSEFKKSKNLNYNSKFKTGDKIIQIRNKYKGSELYLSNGSMGIYKGGNKDSTRLYFLENSYPQKIDHFNEDEELELAYSITVHKSQGSGFDHTFIIIPNKSTLLSKEMIYTALTRSKKSLSLFIYGSSDSYEENARFLKSITERSDIATRRTTLMDKSFWGYSLSPAEGTFVKSRAEYIIYKKLEEISSYGSKFGFSYEKTLILEDESFDIHPDFTIYLSNGETIYWEHLGMLNSQKYVKDWMDRKNIFLDRNMFDQVITTDETHGLTDTKIESLIDEIAKGSINGIKNRFSNHHYYLA